MLKPLAIAVMTLAGPAAFAAGEIYRWRDASGSWHYSDQPRAGAEVIRTSSSGSTTSSAASAATPAAPEQALPPSTNESLPVSKEVAQQVRQDAATAKSRTCEKSRKDYDEMVQALRIKRTDAKGNVVFLNEAEVDAARLEARARRDLACGA
jgi:Domain of unknown function (DUF4124)